MRQIQIPGIDVALKDLKELLANENASSEDIKAKVENGILGIVIRKLVKSNNNKKQIKIS